ncbi:hypothetical protein Tsp_07148 [Trichinella spiralis]|uniref:hypothetical protein n=1 Tax=Trichinella spiralis TaxID=6334 RepID=UPI0001EFBD4D|nr:hypothetical protein Tsp_07148 [Trichinella spiralis]
MHPPVWKLLVSFQHTKKWKRPCTEAGPNVFHHCQQHASSWKFQHNGVLRSLAGNENIRELAGHTVWCMDGTFKIVPEWYHQMFSIHVFKEAAALGVVLQPQTVICDFETAFIPAVQASFPGVQIQGCYFHFCQAVLRKVAELGL